MDKLTTSANTLQHQLTELSTSVSGGFDNVTTASAAYEDTMHQNDKLLSDYLTKMAEFIAEGVKEGLATNPLQTGQVSFTGSGLSEIDQAQINDFVQQIKDTYTSEINSLQNQISDLQSRLNSYQSVVTNVEHLEQDVKITANFPNVNTSAEIEQAFYDLVLAASQYSSKYRSNSQANG